MFVFQSRISWLTAQIPSDYSTPSCIRIEYSNLTRGPHNYIRQTNIETPAYIWIVCNSASNSTDWRKPYLHANYWVPTQELQYQRPITTEATLRHLAFIKVLLQCLYMLLTFVKPVSKLTSWPNGPLDVVSIPTGKPVLHLSRCDTILRVKSTSTYVA